MPGLISPPLIATDTPGGEAPASTDISPFSFPDEIDQNRRYLFYLHGKIIEDQGLPAISPVYGEYQYVEILQTLERSGFVVISELRSKNTDGIAYAQRIASQVKSLLKANVPPGSITVVGASKGAAIAVAVSNILKNSDINYVLLGTCHPSLIEEWKQQNITLYRNVLAIYDYADDEYSGSCEDLFSFSKGRGLGRYDEIVLQVGAGHGILFQPLKEWVLPTIQWARQE